MRLNTLGPAIGKAHVLGEGMGTVFASESKTHVTIAIDKSGRQYWVHRSNINWRKS